MRKLVAGLLLGLGASAVVLLLAATFGLQTAELKAYDWRLRLTADPSSARHDIVLVEINESSLRQLAQVAGRWPWPRVAHASLIDYLARGPARVIAYDVLLLEKDTRSGFPYGSTSWNGKESDAALVDSTKQAGTVIHLADATFEGLTGPGGLDSAPFPDAGYRLDRSIEERPVLTPPYGPLAEVGRSLAHNLLVFDEDGPVRRVIPFVRQGDRFLPSLGVAAAIAAERIRPDDVRVDGEFLRVGSHAVPLTSVQVPVGPDSGQTQPQRGPYVAFRGPAVLPDGVTRPYRSYAFYDLLYSEEQILAGQKPTIDPAVFRDKIVFVGTTAAGLGDTFPTPFVSGGKMPGIQIHASVADNILSSHTIRRTSSRWTLACVAAAGLGMGLVGAFLSPWVAIGVGAAAAVSFGWTSIALFERGTWINLVQPELTIAIALFAGVAYQYLVEGRDKRRIKRLFGRYVPRDVYQQLLSNPGLASLGGNKREMTVLFSDIRGFTTVSEKGEPEAIVAQLNEYFSRMVDVLFRHHGTLDKFVGDMVMALFGAPLDDEQHADHAVAAAVEMVRELETLNRKWTEEGRPALDIGIGINSGEMIAGNIGSEAIMSYTVIGDAVNLGSRLESLNKEYGTRIIISEATRARLTQDCRVRPLGEVIVKGKTRAVAIFEVVAGVAVAAAGVATGNTTDSPGKGPS